MIYIRCGKKVNYAINEKKKNHFYSNKQKLLHPKSALVSYVNEACVHFYAPLCHAAQTFKVEKQICSKTPILISSFQILLCKKADFVVADLSLNVI